MSEAKNQLARKTTRELLSLYASILTELIGRGVVRSRNAPAGDLAERLVQLAYDGELAPPSEKSWDVRTKDEVLLQVKSRVVMPGRRSQSYSPFRSWSFDTCVFVVFDAATYDVLSAYEIKASVIQAAASRSEWVQGDRVTVGGVVKLNGTDVTEKIREAFTRLDA